jgi:hypothetical protein
MPKPNKALGDFIRVMDSKKNGGEIDYGVVHL